MMLPTSTSGMVKTLAITLTPCDFSIKLFVRLSGEGDDRAVGMNGSALDCFDVVTGSVTGSGKIEFYVAELLASFGEDFEANVDAEHVQFVVGGLFAEEVYRRGSGDLRL